MVEAEEPFKLHPTSMSYIYIVFETPETVVDALVAEHYTTLPPSTFPKIWESWLKL